MVRTVGVRPTTFRLKVENSIAELRAYVVLQGSASLPTRCLRGNCSNAELLEYITSFRLNWQRRTFNSKSLNFFEHR